LRNGGKPIVEGRPPEADRIECFRIHGNVVDKAATVALESLENSGKRNGLPFALLRLAEFAGWWRHTCRNSWKSVTPALLKPSRDGGSFT
jgi:hypothetical protein